MIISLFRLALCDLAGSERCSRTQNTGDRLKEAGNINSSLLTLGKCISAMKLKQNAKYDASVSFSQSSDVWKDSRMTDDPCLCRFQHHIPFRESKLTHFLQFFFCGAGRVSMVVNINQNSSCFDETLNVLKFSALAQKVSAHTHARAHTHTHTHTEFDDLCSWKLCLYWLCCCEFITRSDVLIRPSSSVSAVRWWTWRSSVVLQSLIARLMWTTAQTLTN